MLMDPRIANGLTLLLKHTRPFVDSVLKQVWAMQERFLHNSPQLYSSEKEIRQVRYYLRAALYKSYLTSLHLEQLWSLSHAKRDKLFYALQNGLDSLDCSDDELLMISFAFEGFLLQARTFLDFYMLYLCVFLRTGHQGSMTSKAFWRALDHVRCGPFRTKAEKVRNYFAQHVFGKHDNRFGLCPDDWGTLLQSLRDKIAHRDLIRPSFDSDETLMDQVLFDWPTLQATTYDRFCQYQDNAMAVLLDQLSPILYDVQWVPGLYRDAPWE